MITKEEISDLLRSTESYRVERTVSTGNMDKFCEAICAFSNDMPGTRKNGYLIIGADDNGKIAGMKIDDALLKKISGIRSDGNILPLPTMAVERFVFPEGELLVAEVKPSDLPPVRYRGRTFIRVGPRRDIATESEERILAERRCSFMATFDATPCLSATLDAITAFRVNVPATEEVEATEGIKSGIKSDTSQTVSQNNDNQHSNGEGIKSGTKSGIKTGIKSNEEISDAIVEFCKEPKSRTEIMNHFGYTDIYKFIKNFITPLLGTRLRMTVPDKPTSRFQKYVAITE